MPDAVRLDQADRVDHRRCRGVLPGVDRHLEPGLLRLEHRRGERLDREEVLGIGQVDPQNVALMPDRPVHRADARLGAHTARGDGDVADRHIEGLLSAFLRPQQRLQAFIPVQVVTMEGPVRREAHFEEPDVLPGGILEQLPGNTLHHLR